MSGENSEIEQLKSKMDKMDQILNQKVFDNPLKEFQNKMRNELLEFKKIFVKNLKDLDNEFNSKGVSANSNAGAAAVPEVTNEEIKDLKVALEHKNYQVEILKKAFNEYEEATEEQIKNLKTENDKLKYRVQILLNTIQELENKK